MPLPTYAGNYTVTNGTAIFSADDDSAYDVQIVVTDDFSSVTNTVGIPVAYAIHNWNNSGLGYAVGGISTADKFQVYMPTEHYDSISATGTISTEHGTANTNAKVSAKRTDTNVSVWVGVGSAGTNHGVYSDTLGKWMICGDASSVKVNGTAENVTGTVAIAHGGTGQTTAKNALNALLGHGSQTFNITAYVNSSYEKNFTYDTLGIPAGGTIILATLNQTHSSGADDVYHSVWPGFSWNDSSRTLWTRFWSTRSAQATVQFRLDYIYTL